MLKVVASTLMSVVGGAAGPLYGTAFLRAAKATEGDVDADGAVAIVAGALEGIVARGKATTGEKTMVDSWSPALDAAKAVAESGGTAAEALPGCGGSRREGRGDDHPVAGNEGPGVLPGRTVDRVTRIPVRHLDSLHPEAAARHAAEAA